MFHNGTHASPKQDFVYSYTHAHSYEKATYAQNVLTDPLSCVSLHHQCCQNVIPVKPPWNMESNASCCNDSPIAAVLWVLLALTDTEALQEWCWESQKISTVSLLLSQHKFLLLPISVKTDWQYLAIKLLGEDVFLIIYLCKYRDLIFSGSICWSNPSILLIRHVDIKFSPKQCPLCSLILLMQPKAISSFRTNTSPARLDLAKASQ